MHLNQRCPRKKIHTITIVRRLILHLPHKYGLIMVLPTNQCGHDSICVVVDRLTKHVHFLTTKSTIMAIDVSRLVLQTKKFDCMGCLKTSNM
jgi:hypothetical protein